jgi:hypothetical protein
MPEADAVVGPFRALLDADAVARRIAPHVTVLFPLVPAVRVDDVVRAEATCARFPACPPYGGAFAEPVPHLTIGEATAETSTEAILEATRELEPALPLCFPVEAVSLLEEQHDGTWAFAMRFRLG